MAGEYDEKFAEITGILQKMQKSVGVVDEMRLEMRDMRSELRGVHSEVGDLRCELRENTTRLGSLENKVDTLSGQFNDVGVMAIQDHQRIDVLEHRVDNLEKGVH